jgi:hypothetical protein
MLIMDIYSISRSSGRASEKTSPIMCPKGLFGLARPNNVFGVPDNADNWNLLRVIKP